MNHRFDLAAAWDRMPADDQRRLGMAAIATGIGQLARTDGLVAAGYSWISYAAAEKHGGSVVADFVQLHCMTAGMIAPPDLAALGIRQCDACGCTDRCGCPGGCTWIGPLRCSSCVIRHD